MKNAAYLMIVVALGGTVAAVAVADPCDCHCTACDDGCQTDAICVPQRITKSIKVTEWGVQSELICPPRGRMACLDWLRGVGDRANCDSAGCDSAGCDSASDACGPALPGIGPRARKRLMRKTLVYDVPAVQYVAQSCCLEGTGGTSGECDCAQLRIDYARGSSPVESMAAAPSHTNVQWLDVSTAPVTLLLTSATDGPLPAIVVADDDTASTPLKIHWIDGQSVDHVESPDTMSDTLGIQPPAPIATPSAIADEDTFPITLRPIVIQR